MCVSKLVVELLHTVVQADMDFPAKQLQSAENNIAMSDYKQLLYHRAL